MTLLWLVGTIFCLSMLIIWYQGTNNHTWAITQEEDEVFHTAVIMFGIPVLNFCAGASLLICILKRKGY